jgi:hypothetical protein
VSLPWQTVLWAIPLGWFLFMLFFLWAMPRIDFRVGSTHVVVEWMGIAVRKIAIADISRISKRLKGKPEIWRNTLRANHRMLVIYRKNKARPILITPSNRYTFRNKLESAIDRVSA